MDNQDRRLLEACILGGEELNKNAITCEYPLDAFIIEKLRTLTVLISDDAEEYEIFNHRKNIDDLWGVLLEKAIKCLRYYDKREPFIKSLGKKTPKAYGIAELKEYYTQYSDFERVLYGSSRYYRDHVIHVFRTWMSGIELLTKNSCACLSEIRINEKNITISLEAAEKISIWTIVALTHDLGYPLQKAKDIIGITQRMIATFITNPDISVDFSFHGVQNYMNDFIVRLMSSKMVERKERGSDGSDEKKYVARLQPKYYFKFQKSLERNDHGILSTLIIYKLLTYFLESDYNINEDYTFMEEDCRQFYIRREILRAIASHTCNDVYQLYMGSFSFLLRVCDDTQEWGRKYLSELYVKSRQKYEYGDIDLIFKDKKQNECTITESVEISEKDKELVAQLLIRYYKQALEYVTIFRDGQDTGLRDFSFTRIMKISCGKIEFQLILAIKQDDASLLKVGIKYTSTANKNKEFGPEFFTSHNIITDGKFLIKDGDGNSDVDSKPSVWRSGEFYMPLEPMQK